MSYKTYLSNSVDGFPTGRLESALIFLSTSCPLRWQTIRFTRTTRQITKVRKPSFCHSETE